MNISGEPGAFDHALALSSKGQEVIYNDGRYNGPGIHRVDAWKAFEAGRCILFQRRIAAGERRGRPGANFYYVALKI